VLPVAGIGEVAAGEDLAAMLVRAAHHDPVGSLTDGDVVVVTSKVVSKAEARVSRLAKDQAVAGETERVLARRGPTSIVRTRHGLVLAGAGVDASNVESGTLLLLPEDPDASARELRERVARLAGVDVAVVITDTAGRAWRQGQTDIAIGAAGLLPLLDHAGDVDGYGNELAVTLPAVADELAGTADLVKGKLGRRPAAVVRGLAGWVLPRGEHGPGAAALVRPAEADMFGLGAREAVLVAAGLDLGPGDDQVGFGRGVGAAEAAAVLAALAPGSDTAVGSGPDAGGHDDRVDVHLPEADPTQRARLGERLRIAAVALGWRPAPPAEDGAPGPAPATDPTAPLSFVPRGP
jgi:coenzyme F420-0:L-glutamate ligase/coenzyme F420-1:gamma-L-glutamate ligase